MVVEQTVDIPANRRIFLDLPMELPLGKAKITITPVVEKLNVESHDVTAYEAIESLRGLAKEMGSTLTVDRFLEMRREDFKLEETQYYKLFQKSG
jgi:hypothetical protein